MAHELEREQLGTFLAELEAALGPVSKSSLAQARRRGRSTDPEFGAGQRSGARDGTRRAGGALSGDSASRSRASSVSPSARARTGRSLPRLEV